jgi:hypothetical protein
MQNQTAAGIAPTVTGSRRRVERWFYIGAALFMILLSMAGFGPSLIDQSRRNAPPTPLVMAHSIVTSAWLLLFLTQATLVATRRIAVHRRVGRVGPVLALGLILVGGIASIELARRGYDLSGDLTRAFAIPGKRRPGAVSVLLFPFSELLTFGVLVAAGLWYRHRREIHKRLMLLALVPLATEPVVHMVGHAIGYWPTHGGAGRIIGPTITLLLLSVSAIHDRVSHGRIHPVSVWVPLVVFAWMNAVPFVVLPSDAWHHLSAWLIR